MTKKVKVKIEETPEKGFLSLFAKRTDIFQAKVRGKFRNTKWVIMSILLSIYYILPWIRFDRGENAPDQAVMWDTVGRKLYFFYVEIWPQEVYLFTGLLLLAALCLFLFTTLFGRVWCGYACPQTVWTDLFFMIERAVEGDRHRRQRLADAPWNFSKIRKKITKHFLWILVSLCTGGAWVFYFTDVPTFWHDLSYGHIEYASAFWIAFLTTSTYLLAGFAREQVCTYMCPYARFQGAMFDNDTLIVSYDEERGEPRGKANKEEGDCIDCGRCVAVCPTGIDIRDGQQYQCINCGLCIDACNTIMDKTKKDRGLIRYNSINNIITEDTSLLGATTKLRLIRPRTILYTILILMVTTVLTYSLTKGRYLVEMNVLHSRNPLYITLSNGNIRNVYTIRVVNKQHQDIKANLTLEGLDNAIVYAPRLSKIPANNIDLPVKAGDVNTFKVFVEKPSAFIHEEKESFTFHINDGKNKTDNDSYFIGHNK